MSKNLRNFALTAGLLAVSSAAFSEFYVGGSLGQADFEPGDAQTSLELKTGYRFNNYIAVEGYYLDLGKSEQTTLFGNVENELDGVGLSVLGIYPINEQFEVYGKLGIYAWDSSVEISGNVEDSVSDEDFVYGIGAAWKVNDMVKLNLGYDTVSFGELDTDADIYSIGATISF